ncbi:MAG: hypothetical protein J5I93_29655 [Pirellulaceae bacterium]|nr:hypothetical protein [Pirellulaceae bacterium]
MKTRGLLHWFQGAIVELLSVAAILYLTTGPLLLDDRGDKRPAAVSPTVQPVSATSESSSLPPWPTSSAVWLPQDQDQAQRAAYTQAHLEPAGRGLVALVHDAAELVIADLERAGRQD